MYKSKVPRFLLAHGTVCILCILMFVTYYYGRTITVVINCLVLWPLF